MFVIKWTNKYSGETGYVQCIADNHFISTSEKSTAAKYRNENEVNRILDKLYEIGEDINNDFEAVKAA